MKITPNLNNTWRVTYLVIGLALAVSPLVLSLSKVESIMLPILGAVSLLTGATGF
jgi:hypothetical protein